MDGVCFSIWSQNYVINAPLLTLYSADWGVYIRMCLGICTVPAAVCYILGIWLLWGIRRANLMVRWEPPFSRKSEWLRLIGIWGKFYSLNSDSEDSIVREWGSSFSPSLLCASSVYFPPIVLPSQPHLQVISTCIFINFFSAFGVLLSMAHHSLPNG